MGNFFASAGHIEPFFVSRGPHSGHKGYLNATIIGPRGPDVARGPYVAPSCFRLMLIIKMNFLVFLLKLLKINLEIPRVKKIEVKRGHSNNT